MMLSLLDYNSFDVTMLMRLFLMLSKAARRFARFLSKTIVVAIMVITTAIAIITPAIKPPLGLFCWFSISESSF